MKYCPIIAPVRRNLVLTACLSAAVLLNGGCQKSETKPAAGKPKVALVMKSLANEFFSTMADGARKHQAANAGAYDLIVNGIKNETDLAEQVNLVEQMMARQVNAIVIAPADSKALVTVLKRAKEAGILVVNIDNKLDAGVLKQAGLAVPFVGPDNRAGARKVGEALAKHLKPGDQVAIIEGIPTAFNGQQRRLGFEDAMKAAGMNIVTVQSGNWEMEKANNVAAAMLSEHAGPQSHPLRERQHGPRRGRGHPGRGQSGPGPRGRLRQHRRHQADARRWPSRGHRRPARRPTRSLRHRGRA